MRSLAAVANIVLGCANQRNKLNFAFDDGIRGQSRTPFMPFSLRAARNCCTGGV